MRDPLEKFDHESAWTRMVATHALHRDGPLFLDTTDRMRRTVRKAMEGRSVEDVAARANVPATAVTTLMDQGHAPLLYTAAILQTLGINASAYPPECVAS